MPARRGGLSRSALVLVRTRNARPLGAFTDGSPPSSQGGWPRAGQPLPAWRTPRLWGRLAGSVSCDRPCLIHSSLSEPSATSARAYADPQGSAIWPRRTAGARRLPAAPRCGRRPRRPRQSGSLPCRQWQAEVPLRRLATSNRMGLTAVRFRGGDQWKSWRGGAVRLWPCAAHRLSRLFAVEQRRRRTGVGCGCRPPRTLLCGASHVMSVWSS